MSTNNMQALQPVTTDETCPYCGQWIPDLWEVLTVDGKSEAFGCEHCGHEIRGTLTVDIIYALSTTED